MTDTKAGPTTTTSEQTPLPAYVTTPLLTRITESSLDEDYRVVAARRAAQAGGGGHAPAGLDPRLGSPAATGWQRASWSPSACWCSIAAVQTSRNADVTSASRAALVSQVEARPRCPGRPPGADRRGSRTTTSSADDRTERLTTDALAQIAALREQQAVTGYVAVRGPGVG